MLKKEDVEKIVKKEESIFWKTFFLIYFYGQNLRPMRQGINERYTAKITAWQPQPNH